MGLGKARQGIANQVRLAQQRLTKAGTDDPVRALGGCEAAAFTMTLAEVDVDSDGKIASEDLEATQRMVDSTRDELLNAGVVAALILSIMYGLAYDENETLLSLYSSEAWDWQEISDLTSFLANMTAVCSAFVTVYLSSMMYSQISFWMPTLEAQLWYVSMSRKAAAWVSLSKDLTIYASLTTLALEVAVTGGWLDLLAYAPVVALGIVAIVCQLTLVPQCKAFLAEQVGIRAGYTATYSA